MGVVNPENHHLNGLYVGSMPMGRANKSWLQVTDLSWQAATGPQNMLVLKDPRWCQLPPKPRPGEIGGI